MTRERAADVRVGLVCNPHAGKGRAAVADVVRTLLRRIVGPRLVIVEGTLEREIAGEERIACDAVACPERGPSAFDSAARLIDEGVDVIVGVGGDGTLCDIATALLGAEAPPPLLGVGVGSANVGPLVGVLARDVARLVWERLREGTVHGVDALRSGARIGTAFNDVVFANSYFGTRNGRRVDLDASAKLAGQDRPVEPRSVCGRGLRIAKNGRPMLSNRDGAIAQVIASPVNEARLYAGKAISGLMCWAPYVGNHGVLAVASEVMVRTVLSAEHVRGAEPLRLSHVSFGPEDRLEITGLDRGAVVVIDGNPTCELEASDVIELRLRVDAIRVLRPGAADEAGRASGDRG